MTKIDNRELTRLNHVNCGEVVHLQVVTPTKPIRLKTRLIGIDPNMSVILAFGNDASWIKALPHLKETNDVIVRFMNSEQQQANVTAFRTSIQKIMTITGRWLVLDYPKNIESVPLRKHRRVDVSIEAALVNSESDTVLANGVLIDVSIQGCAFVCKKQGSLSIGGIYQLLIDLGDGSSKVTLSVALKSNKELGVNDEVQYGLVFTTPEDVQSAIQQLLLHYLQK
ncbi:PilZ domain-containing protein [Psychromonas sp. 14N.309.X.WAT.B.A12]|uniref:PilZ domain-containing protein n=1 Tax=unclassified Psychromonas TaxID=2614957 RepID=UPI0025B090D0|nr:PilZ domain-containing protein [Psychromonas sp. 14N.309.X.WAT.B.A12]MDN2662400.1 PilZ domain-containing protein [Psychromonas sp. 14N.309.X.WAT.B.A12]